MVKDVMGNDLKVGDKIAIDPNLMPKLVLGVIEQLSEGGLAIPAKVPGMPQGAQAIQGGTLMIKVMVGVQFNPTSPITAIVKITKDGEALPIANA